ncbi:periphilin-1-like isoform X1 [Salarias fasciatus]|nr:periphilin-1-like isoform X1 [Salarias fasciatus]
MDPVRAQDASEAKSSMSHYREHGDESFDMKQADKGAAPTQDDKRPIRRVRSPSRPRAWLSHSYKPKLAQHFYKSRFPRDDRPGYKPGFQRYPRAFYHRAYFHKRDHFLPKPHYMAPLRKKNWDRENEKERYEPREKDWDREKEKERYEPREKDWDREKEEWYEQKDKDWDRQKEEWYEPKESINEGSSLKLNSTPQSFSSRSSSSRDKDMQFTAGQIDRNQSRERDHRRSKSKDGERSRDREPPSTVSQTAARDRAIQQKRREIDEVYYQECEMFGVVTKMLIAKDPSLEQSIQSSLQENLKDIGERCVDAMKKFIEDYDSRGLSH